MSSYFHKDAVKNFNSRGITISQFIDKLEKEIGSKESFPSERPSVLITGEDIIKNITTSKNDIFGNEFCRYEGVEGVDFGISELNYNEYDKLCRAIYKVQTVFTKISFSNVKNILFKWCLAYHFGKIEMPLCSYCEIEFDKIIEDVEIWIPIAGTEIEKSTAIGNVIFENIRKSDFDNWEEKYQKNNSSNNDKDRTKAFSEYLKRIRKKMQGLMAGRVKISADPERAGQLALGYVEDSLEMLRFFDPANHEPMANSTTTILGKEHLLSINLLFIQDNNLKSSKESIIERGIPRWRIGTKLIDMMMNSGLKTLSNILRSDNKTNFQISLINSLKLYSRVSLVKTFGDKLVYLLVALESILLKNTNEGIQQNIGERIAFTVTKDINERRSIIKILNDVYNLRSRFLHHGNEIDKNQLETLREFMRISWKFFAILIQNSSKYETKEQMIENLDKIKLS